MFLPSGEMAIAGWSNAASRWPGGSAIVSRLTAGVALGLHIQTATLRAATAHGTIRRHKGAEACDESICAFEPESLIHFSSRQRSPTDCQRASGSLARQIFTRR